MNESQNTGLSQKDGPVCFLLSQVNALYLGLRKMRRRRGANHAGAGRSLQALRSVPLA